MHTKRMLLKSGIYSENILVDDDTVQCVHCVQVCIRLIHKLNRFFSEILCRQFSFFFSFLCCKTL